jgi:ComF family protein
MLELLAPALCAGCDLPLTGDEALCEACQPLLEPAPPELRPPAPAAAAYCYQGPLADAVRRIKYAGRSENARPLARLLGEAAVAYAGCVDCVVPVPLHPRKLALRGCNLSALLARGVAARLGVRLEVGWLRRVRATRAQAGLVAELRADNVRGAFAASPVHPNRQHVLLIDDVRTTGATSEAAADALRAQGHEVLCLALAWAPK